VRIPNEVLAEGVLNMSVKRMGSSERYAEGWERAFGGKRSKSATTTVTPKRHPKKATAHLTAASKKRKRAK